MTQDGKTYGYAYTASFSRDEFAAKLSMLLTQIRNTGASIEHISTQIMPAQMERGGEFHPEFVAQIVYLADPETEDGPELEAFVDRLNDLNVG